MDEEIFSKVWLLHGTFGGATPGLLALSGNKISFTTAEGEHFNVPAAEVKEVKWPFLQFGLGFNASVSGQKYKFTFMKPNGAGELDDSALSQLAVLTRIGRGVDAMATLSKWGDNKKTARQWKALLGG